MRRQLDAAKAEKKARRVKHAFNKLQSQVLEMVPRAEVEQRASDCGFYRREPKAIRAFEFLMCCAMASMVESKRSFASIWRLLAAAAGVEVARSPVTQRFGEASARLLQGVFERVVERVPSANQPEMLERLRRFSDVIAHDGTALKLSPLLKKLFPATRTNTVDAAGKLHATASITQRRVLAVEITGERHSELAVAWDEPVEPGTLHMNDLGYMEYDYIGHIMAHDAHFLSRVKSNAALKVLRVNHGVRAPKRSEGMKLGELEFFRDNRPFDVIVGLPTSSGVVEARVVGIFNEQTGEYHRYMTDLPVDEFSAEEVADLYCLRWVVELLFKLLKSFCHLDHLDTQDPDAVRTHIYGSLIASVVLYSMVVASANAAGIHPSRISELTVAAAAPLLILPLMLLWLDRELTKEALAQMLMRTIVVGCINQNPGRHRQKWGFLFNTPEE